MLSKNRLNTEQFYFELDSVVCLTLKRGTFSSSKDVVKLTELSYLNNHDSFTHSLNNRYHIIMYMVKAFLGYKICH